MTKKGIFFGTPRGEFTGKDLEFNQVKYRGFFDKISEKRTILGIFQEKRPLYIVEILLLLDCL